MADVLTSTYNPAGMGDTIYEDVESVIQNITPHKTPFIASVGNTKVKNTLHEWLEDELKAPAGSNAAVEGADEEATVRDIPTRLKNYTQILTDTFKVTATQDAVDTIGRSKTSTYQLEKSLKYLNTELEYTAINSAAYNAGAAGTAREMMGLEGFITTNDFSFDSTANTNLFTEKILMNMSEAIFEASEDDNHVLLVNGTTAQQIAGWDDNSRITVNTNASEKKLVMAVMVLETPFGTIKLVTDRYIEVTTATEEYTSAYLYEPGKIDVGWLRNFKTNELAKTGDSRKYQTVGEATLIVKSEKAAAKCGSIYSKTP